MESNEKIFEVTEHEVKTAFIEAKTDEVKDALFFKSKNKPNLDDYKSIKTYEDACEALGVAPIAGDNLFALQDEGCDKHVIALMKLETISRALWGKSFQPTPDPEGRKTYYYPWFAFYTKKEMENMDEDDRRSLLSVGAGFGDLYTIPHSSYETTGVGFHLYQETEDQALYFGKQFAEIWADYLGFNFVICDHVGSSPTDGTKSLFQVL